MNKITLLGNVGRDPEIGTFKSGDSYARMSLATTKRFTTRNGEKSEQTIWHNLMVAGKALDVVKSFVKKGTLLLIEGEQVNGSYTNASGQTVNTSEVRVINLQVLTPKAPTSNVPQYDNDDDLPEFLR